jgi:Fe-S cluster assembly protein SufD
MTAATSSFLDTLLSGTRTVPSAPTGWLNERRGRALERANALSVPTTRDEDWRFTDLAPLVRAGYRQVEQGGAPAPESVAAFFIPEASVRVTFIDGVFAPAHSSMASLPAGVRVATLTQMLQSDATGVEPWLARIAKTDDRLFGALNTANLRDAAVVLLGRGAGCAVPVHVLHIATQDQVAVHPRCLVVAEAGAECAVIEDFVALTDGTYFNNVVTEIHVGANAQVRHVRLQRESMTAFHIAQCAVTLERDSSYTAQQIALGARLSRYDLDVCQKGENATARLDGLALIGARQLADTHSAIDHAVAHCQSEQLHKTIVGDASHAVFSGKIRVHPGAQQTNSSQSSRNLVLSERARVDTKPQLEIFADDVKCAHGATVGQIDPEHLFYLKSRGLSDARARDLLTYAFAAEVILRIPVPSLVTRLESAVLARTQTGASS